MLNRRALFGLPLAAMPASSKASEPRLAAAFECGYQARTQLTNIVGFAHLIEDASIPPDRVREYAGYIQQLGSALIKAVDEAIDCLRPS